MSNGKSILIDTSKCTACRGCQVACKQWNELPGTKTKQTGTYQNPPDLGGETYKVVRFSEGRTDAGKPYWYFFSDQCRHCLEPPCVDEMSNSAEGGAVKDEATGAVYYTEKSKGAAAEDIRNSCPYNIPRQNEKTKLMTKCTMCLDRQKGGMLPACVKSCPTGAMTFGDRDEILSKAQKRVEFLKKTYPKAAALNANEVRVIYIVTDDPKKYHEYAAV